MRALKVIDGLLAALSALVCLYVVVQTEPMFEGLWVDGTSLGNRAGQEAGIDTAVGVLGLVLILEATRRSIGWALPSLALIFLGYAWLGSGLPETLVGARPPTKSQLAVKMASARFNRPSPSTSPLTSS